MVNSTDEKIINLFKNKKDYYEDRIKDLFPSCDFVFNQKQGVIIYPAGRKTEVLVQNLIKNGLSVVAVGDSNNNLWGKKIGPCQIFSPEDLAKKYLNFPLIVSSTDYRQEITETLKKLGFQKIFHISFLNFINAVIFPVFPEYHKRFHSLFEPDNQAEIIRLNSLWEDEESRGTFLKVLQFRLSFNELILNERKFSSNQYFEKKFMSFSNEEVFIDCGAFKGETIEQFNLITSAKFKKIYAFEPDRNNFEKLEIKCKEIGPTKIDCEPSGVYGFTGKVNFMETGDAIARIVEDDASLCINVVSLDDFMKDKERVTFIKMDIEGAETEALLGAKEIIQKYKPKLAISVYHNATDLWEIPLLIKSLNSEYKIYLRHYSNEVMDTVCYAV
ncbi:MAG: hypothetical protein COU29_04010 [Candidatus Magasanikbacteria bacterium CG10_big_fil_rev_8_21_14_0_10_36_32]|uniref:Methyltransferase FkbM domain-containing protein n=1 Tax=Candidatus Magasanikbacteria bacterium CG10_big_fil_rev_8_21_14_0_10_36_32 TaxID=1974646 RepID=A0A2M6W5R4_9BACT|nr:MAG: hypothetical protein COU29_04010 [Candidatus Magasanikbacteria bacterium CG10_big_fil_rev_8_21_14_0_10_36_32]